MLRKKIVNFQSNRDGEKERERYKTERDIGKKKERKKKKEKERKRKKFEILCVSIHNLINFPNVRQIF